MFKSLSLFGFAAAICVSGFAQHSHNRTHQPATSPLAEDKREVVKFPPQMREHILSNMRDHLLVLSEIQDHLGQGHFEIAGKIAENRLGMTSLKLHGAHESAKYMPKGMQDIGTSMHRSASRFAVLAQESEVTRDWAKTLAALSKVTSACVACHAVYKVQ